MKDTLFQAGYVLFQALILFFGTALAVYALVSLTFSPVHLVLFLALALLLLYHAIRDISSYEKINVKGLKVWVQEKRLHISVTLALLGLSALFQIYNPAPILGYVLLLPQSVVGLFTQPLATFLWLQIGFPWLNVLLTPGVNLFAQVWWVWILSDVLVSLYQKTKK